MIKWCLYETGSFCLVLFFLPQQTRPQQNIFRFLTLKLQMEKDFPLSTPNWYVKTTWGKHAFCYLKPLRCTLFPLRPQIGLKNVEFMPSFIVNLSTLRVCLCSALNTLRNLCHLKLISPALLPIFLSLPSRMMNSSFSSSSPIIHVLEE
jgi:hypothetical protein